MSSFQYGRMKSKTLQRGYQQYYLMQVTKVNINFDSCVHGYVLKNFQGHKNDNLHQQAPPPNTYNPRITMRKRKHQMFQVRSDLYNT